MNTLSNKQREAGATKHGQWSNAKRRHMRRIKDISANLARLPHNWVVPSTKPAVCTYVEGDHGYVEFDSLYSVGDSFGLRHQ